MSPIRAPDAVYWELEPGERISWCGRPEAALYVSTTTRWGRVLMGLPFAGVGAVLAAVAPPLGMLFVLMGCGMLATPAWKYLKARNTVYAVTSSRLLVIEHVFRQRVASRPAAAIGRVERRERRDGSGSLVFDRVGARAPRHRGHRHDAAEEEGFFAIRDVGAAWRMVMDLKNGFTG